MSKTIHELSNEELIERFDKEFSKKYYASKYSEENWLLVQEIYDDAKEKMKDSSFALSIYNDAFYKMGQIEFKKERYESSNRIMDNIKDTLSKVGEGFVNVYDKTKFLFSIPALTIASFILTSFIHLILGIFIYTILPEFIDEMMIKTIIAGIIFIVLKLIIMFSLSDDSILFDFKKYIIKQICTIPIYALVFLIFINYEKSGFIQMIMSIFYSHMWLSAFTHEYVISPMIALIINCLLPIGIYYLINKKENK